MNTNSKLAELKATISRLTNIINQMQEAINIRDRRSDEDLALINQLQDKLAAEKKANKELTECVRRMRHELGDIQLENHKLSMQVEELQFDNHVLKEQREILLYTDRERTRAAKARLWNV